MSEGIRYLSLRSPARHANIYQANGGGDPWRDGRSAVRFGPGNARHKPGSLPPFAIVVLCAGFRRGGPRNLRVAQHLVPRSLGPIVRVPTTGVGALGLR